jgi:anti-sigma factor RsiW
MTCGLWRDQIGTYIDGELAPNDEAEVADHLRSCPDCNAFAAESIHLKRAVGQGGRRYQPSTEFRAQIAHSIGSESKPRRGFLMQLALVSALVIAVLAGVLALQGRGNDVNREIADIHLNATASANPVDVVSTDMHTVKPWFEGRVPFTFNLPDLANSPFTLLGGRVVYVRGTPCALLLFQYRLHRISTVIGPATVIGGARGQQTLAGGFHMIRSLKNGYAFVTVGDPGMDIVNDLAQRVRAAQ